MKQVKSKEIAKLPVFEDQWQCDLNSYIMCCAKLPSFNSIACGLQSGESLLINSDSGVQEELQLNADWKCEQPFFFSKSPVTAINCTRNASKTDDLVFITRNNLFFFRKYGHFCYILANVMAETRIILVN